ncbi:hypothetical protein JHK87_056929 [Glycine soja]|nr:hypothetical protein JHK87_056929 [Glycine soja]
MGDPYGLPEDLRRLIPARSTHLNPSDTHLIEPLCVHHGLSSAVAAATASATPPITYDANMVGDVFFPRGFTHHFAHHHDYSSSSGMHLFFCEEIIMGARIFFQHPESLSLIMAEEFGYQRSGKKCKEKFENLYKYYKKTKEGKASRQDGKHYRFFRQLEAICGDQANNTHAHASTSDKTHRAGGNTAATIQKQTFTTNQDHNNGDSNNNPKCSESLSISNSSQFETSSSENNDEDLSAIAFMMKQSRDEKQKGLDHTHRPSDHRRVRKSWRTKVEEIVDSHMRKIIQTQDAWMERMLSVVEQREQEMASREEERKRKESMWFDQQVHELWAKEKAWVEARDAALIEVVRKHIGIGIGLGALPLVEEESPNKNKSQGSIDANEFPSEGVDPGRSSSSRWTEMEISNLMQLRTSFEQRFRENNNGYMENGVWDEIAAKMACLGFDRSASECKQIWEEISISLRRTVDECDDGAKRRPWYLGLKLTDDDL